MAQKGSSITTPPTGILHLRGILLVTLHFWLFLAVVGLMYGLIRSRHTLNLRAMTESDGAEAAHRIQTELDEQLRNLAVLHTLWASAGYQFNPSFIRALDNLSLDYPPYSLVAFADHRSICRRVTPWGDHESLLRADLHQHPDWAPLIDRAKETRVITASLWPADDRPALLGLAIPLPPPASSENSASSILLARLEIQSVLREALSERFHHAFNIELCDGDELIFRAGAPVTAAAERIAMPIVIADHSLVLWIEPTAVAAPNLMAKWVLWGGIPIALIFTLALGQIFVYRARESREMQRHLAALESLNEISTATIAHIDSHRQVLDRFAQSAFQLLSMDRSAVGLLDASGTTLTLAAVAGNIPPGARRQFNMADLPATRRCLDSGEILFVENCDKVSEPFNTRVTREFHAGSIVVIPLRMDNRAIGVMVVSASRPRSFTDAERRLARLLGSQAAVILTTSRLYEQTLRDARTQTTLLRELHHRVKNSLAGIVGLLSMDDADLPPSARRRLDRIIERIQTMARAHDLFSGNLNSVDIRQLVHEVVASLSIVSRPEIQVRVECCDGHLRLATPQAVSLALVLHELCSNAMVHALNGRGTLMIRVGCAAQRIRVDVIDDGCGLPPHLLDGAQAGPADNESFPQQTAGTETASAPSGMGLLLVRELTGRELQGVFRLHRRDDGGTIATVEFPLNMGDAEGAAYDERQRGIGGAARADRGR